MRYFICGFLFMLAGALLFVFTVYKTDLRRHIDITTVHLADAKKDLLSTCHDIYIIGDSSGNGIDPAYMSHKMGRDVISLVISANMGWQGYENIARTVHKSCAPELIIMYMTARGIYYDASQNGTFDGFYTNLLFGGIGATGKYLAQNFRVLPQTVLITLRKFRLEPFEYQLPEYYNQAQRNDIDNSLEKNCEITHDLSDGRELDKFPDFKNRIKALFPDTEFIFVAAPLPRCTINKDEIEPVNAHMDKGVDYMDNLYFRDYTHLSKAGVKPASDRLIKAINGL